jgi:hypothetical protein
MTRTQVSHQVAARTGEPLSVIRRLGFQVQHEPREEPAPAEWKLVLACPFCREPVEYPGRSRDGSRLLADCEACDVYFEFDERDVFLASAGRLADRGPVRHRFIPA